MREIKFRGKRIDNAETVTGYYHQDPEDGHFITDFEYINIAGTADEPPSGYFTKNVNQVIPESVGQFTGLKDINGVDVYEWDVLENTFTIKNYDDDDYHLENRYSSQYETKTSKSVVKFIKGEFIITSGASFNSCKIIGNIHENPELITQHKN